MRVESSTCSPQPGKVQGSRGGRARERINASVKLPEDGRRQQSKTLNTLFSEIFDENEKWLLYLLKDQRNFLVNPVIFVNYLFSFLPHHPALWGWVFVLNDF